MLTVEEALDRILAVARLTEVEELPLERCFGRVPATFSLVAPGDVPPFANSSMDGYALRAEDTPGELRVLGEIAAGASTLPTVAPGGAVRIMTGAPMPPGADAVMPIEDAVESGEMVRMGRAERGAFVRAAGHDTQAGEEVALAREPLSPASIGVLATLGAGAVGLRRRPRVAILSTGDELMPPGAVLAPGQIHDANTAALAAAVAGAGGDPVLLPHLPDDAAGIEAVLRTGVSEADLLVASGGVSVGRHDHVRTAIEAVGRLDLWRIAVQPGKPLAFGAIDDVPVLGLPGNPVSALVTFELFARPLLRAMLGLSGSGRLRVRAHAAATISKDPGREAYLRVRIRPDGDGYLADGAGGQASSQLRSMAAANGLLVVPAGEPSARAGAAYDAIVLGEI